MEAIFPKQPESQATVTFDYSQRGWRCSWIPALTSALLSWDILRKHVWVSGLFWNLPVFIAWRKGRILISVTLVFLPSHTYHCVLILGGRLRQPSFLFNRFLLDRAWLPASFWGHLPNQFSDEMHAAPRHFLLGLEGLGNPEFMATLELAPH